MPDPTTDSASLDYAEQALSAATNYASRGQVAPAMKALQEADRLGIGRQRLADKAIKGHFNTLGRELALAGNGDAKLRLSLRRSLATSPDGVRAPRAQSSRIETPQPEPSAFQWMIDSCLSAGDITAAIDKATAAYPFADSDKVAWFLSLSNTFLQKKDQPKAEYFARQAVAAIAPGEGCHSTLGWQSLQSLVDGCLQADDIHSAIDEMTAFHPFKAGEKASWFLLLSSAFLRRKDRPTAEHFARQAMAVMSPGDECRVAATIQQLVKAGSTEAAMALMSEMFLPLSPLGRKLGYQSQVTLAAMLRNIVREATAKAQHGQMLLLTYLEKNLGDYRKIISPRKPLLLEIGTTREEVQGQGSTRELADFCNAQQIDFVTVDMDPHNSDMARQMFNQLGYAFQAITSKGEDYLRMHPGPIDFVFLDAYDFDHGKHSELRQSRYQQFLGARIDEQQCHQMHLDCAKSLVNNLADQGVICVDDTWQENNQWTAKGTLAMPYLLQEGFKLIEAHNRAALLVRGAVESQREIGLSHASLQ